MGRPEKIIPILVLLLLLNSISASCKDKINTELYGISFPAIGAQLPEGPKDAHTGALWLLYESAYSYARITDASRYEVAYFCLYSGSISAEKYINALSGKDYEHNVIYAGFEGNGARQPGVKDGVAGGLWGAAWLTVSLTR